MAPMVRVWGGCPVQQLVFVQTGHFSGCFLFSYLRLKAYYFQARTERTRNNGALLQELACLCSAQVIASLASLVMPIPQIW